MDANVKQKQSRALAAAQGGNTAYPLLQQPLGLCQPGGFLPQDEVLDLTYSPPADGLADLGGARESLPFWEDAAHQPQPPGPQSPLHFSFPAPFDGTALGPAQHEPLPPAPPPLPDVSVLDQDINYKELLEEMLNSLNVEPRDHSQERQSVIQFSGPFANF